MWEAKKSLHIPKIKRKIQAEKVAVKLEGFRLEVSSKLWDLAAYLLFIDSEVGGGSLQ